MLRTVPAVGTAVRIDQGARRAVAQIEGSALDRRITVDYPHGTVVAVRGAVVDVAVTWYDLGHAHCGVVRDVRTTEMTLSTPAAVADQRRHAAVFAALVVEHGYLPSLDDPRTIDALARADAAGDTPTGPSARVPALR